MNGWHKDCRAVATSMTQDNNDPASLPGTEQACSELVCIYACTVPATHVTGEDWGPTEITMQGKTTHDYYCVRDPNSLLPLRRGG